MAFDSTVGGAAANSYIPVATATAYLADVANDTAWLAATATERETALVRATRFIENRYIGRWPGRITEGAQALSWPRQYARDRERRMIADNVIPSAVVAAASELAVIALTDPNLFVNQNRTEGGVKREKVRVGPIEQEVEYSGSLSTIDVDRRADNVLRTLIGSTKLRRT
jgi:hypothetical protein